MKINYKHYVEKNKNHIKLTAIIIGILIIIIIILLILLRLNFMIGEQLRMTLSPEYSEKNSTSFNNVSLEVEVQLYNKFVCSAVCNFMLMDLSHDTVLYSGSFSSKAYKNKQQSFDIFLEKYGYGTNIYLYSIECSNTKTTLCPSSNESLIRKSLFIVNYEPSIDQKNALNYSLEAYDAISKNIINSTVMIREINNIISFVNLSFDNENYSNILYELDSLEKDVDILLYIWNTDDYESVKKFIVSKNIVARSYNVSNSALNYISYINNTINQNNLLIDAVLITKSNLEEYKTILLNIALSKDVPLSYPNMNYSSRISSISSFDFDLRNNMLNDIISGNSMIDKLNDIRYNKDTKEKLYLDIIELNDSINNKTAKILNATILRLSEQSPSIYIYSKILCDLYNYEETKNKQSNNIFTINDVCSDYYALGTGVNVAMLSNISNISDASKKLEMICSRSRLLLDVMETDLWNFSDIQDNFNISENASTDLITDSSETLLLQYKLLIDYESINNQNNNYPYELMTLYKNYISTSLMTKYNVSEPEEILQGYIFNNSNLVFNSNNMLLSDIKFIEYSCYFDKDSSNNGSNNLIIFNEYNKDTINIPSINSLVLNHYITPQINLSDYGDISVIKPPENIKQCCMYNKCQSCEKHPSKNPLILLHGHSFNLNNDAYQSLEIFNDFEKKFSEEKLYYLSGIPIIGKGITYGILGKYYVPVIIKPTYYVATYNDILGLTSVDSKTENIDTYALRLSESIDYTLQITGSSKVDIVTHSMGGLVLRRYTQIFGTQKIGTVILIAAPNKGISDSIYSFCKIFGYDGECENMRSEGIYIKKLNDYSTQPNMEKLYLVVGTGCETEGFDSDGVVLVNNSLLPIVSENNILFVEGKCSGTKLLHNDLLDTKQYPEVYEFIKSKLDK